MSHYLMALSKIIARKRKDATCHVLKFRRLDGAGEMT